MLRRVIGVLAAFFFAAGIVMYFDKPEPAVTTADFATPTTTAVPVELANAEPVPTGAEKVAAWKTTALFMPKTLPAGWVLRASDVLSAKDTKEGCAQAELNYEDPADETEGFLYVYQFSTACARPLTGSTLPFQAGPHKGVARFDDGGIVAQLTVGSTTLQADTDLKFAELVDVLDELVPLDPATLPKS